MARGCAGEVLEEAYRRLEAHHPWKLIGVEAHLLGLGFEEFLAYAFHRTDQHDSVAHAISQPELLEHEAERESEWNVLEIDDHGRFHGPLRISEGFRIDVDGQLLTIGTLGRVLDLFEDLFYGGSHREMEGNRFFKLLENRDVLGVLFQGRNQGRHASDLDPADHLGFVRLVAAETATATEALRYISAASSSLRVPL